jgi:AcrR family transcriptional regulator
VTPGATYHHFEDKDALLVAVAEEGFELFRAELEDAARRPASSPRDRSRNVGAAYVLFAVKHPTRFRVMVGLGVQDHLRSGVVLGEAKATFRLVRDVLMEGLKERPEDVVSEREVLGWWSTVHGLAFLAIDGHLGRGAATPARAEAIVEEVLAALDARAHPRPNGPT